MAKGPQSKKPGALQAQKPSAPLPTEIIKEILDLEKNKVEVEKLRQANAAKQLEMSAQSSREATEVAKQDLLNQKDYFHQDFQFKKYLVRHAAWISGGLVLAGMAMVVVLAFVRPELVPIILDYAKQIAGLLVGAALGYAFKGAREKAEDKDKSDP